MLKIVSFCLATWRLRTPRELKSCRRLTTVSLYSRLPMTVHRLQLLPKSNLSAYKDETSDVEEQVVVSSDGLVYPWVSDKIPSLCSKTLSGVLLMDTQGSNGSLFMPNTILMQDLARNAFDQYLEEDETRKPVFISIKRGMTLDHIHLDRTRMILRERCCLLPLLPFTMTHPRFHFNHFNR